VDTTPATAPVERQASFLPTALIGLAFLAVFVIFAASSSWYFAFKAVHVVFAVVWVGGGMLLTILALIAERRNDPEELQTIAHWAALVGQKLFSPSAGIVLAAGIAMMINTNWGWEHFWIVFGLLGFASSFVVGVTVLSPMAKRVDGLLQTAGPRAPETQAAISRILLIARFDVAVLMLVVVDMVVKPFS
jgi:uncharacterized membrane protein